jgi:hypothetical protein
MMSEQVVRMGVMWILAGLGAGWLAETCVIRRGHGLLVDMGLGVGAGLLGGAVFVAISDRPSGMLAMFVFAFALAIGLILAQRVWWPSEPGAWERKARLRLSELGGPSLGEKGAVSALHGSGGGVTGRPASARVLMRVAATGIFLLRGLPLELQQAARIRAVSDGTTLHQVLLKGLGEYAAGTWTPQADGKRSAA